MDWWVAVAIGAAVVALPYTYLVFKFAAAGWVAGIRGYLRTTRERKDRGDG